MSHVSVDEIGVIEAARDIVEARDRLGYAVHDRRDLWERLSLALATAPAVASDVSAIDALAAEVLAWCNHVERFAYTRHDVGSDASPHLLASAARRLVAQIASGLSPRAAEVEPPVSVVPVGGSTEAMGVTDNAILLLGFIAGVIDARSADSWYELVNVDAAAGAQTLRNVVNGNTFRVSVTQIEGTE